MTPAKLMLAALEKKSVIGSNRLGCGHRPTPAAFVIGMPFIYVMQSLRELKIFTPKPKPSRYKNTPKTKL